MHNRPIISGQFITYMSSATNKMMLNLKDPEVIDNSMLQSFCLRRRVIAKYPRERNDFYLRIAVTSVT